MTRDADGINAGWEAWLDDWEQRKARARFDMEATIAALRWRPSIRDILRAPSVYGRGW
jgi:hypothetical protein